MVDVRTSSVIIASMKDLPHYELSKTLRFSLIPQFETADHIKNGELIKEDKERDANYQKAKKILDQYHQRYIEKALGNYSFKDEKLTKAEACYIEKNKKTDDGKVRKERSNELNNCYTALRKDLVAQFKDAPKSTNDIFKILFKKKKGTEGDAYSENSLLNNEEVSELEKFDKFTTYFGKYDTNRENLYTDKDQATAIAYRTINDNLDKFLFNRQNWNSIREKLSKDKLETLRQKLSDELQALSIGDVINAFDLNTFNQCILQKGITAYNTILGGKTILEEKTSKEEKKIQGLNELINEYNQGVGDKKNRLPRLVPLFKQIMGNASSLSFVKPCFDSDDELWDAVNDYYLKELLGDASEEESYLSQIAKLIEDLDVESSQGVYINTRKISSVSHHVFKDYGYIKRRFEEEWKNQKKNKKKEFTMPDACELSELLRIVGKDKQQETLNALKRVDIPYSEELGEEKQPSSPTSAVTEIKNRFDKIKGFCNNEKNKRKESDLRKDSSEKDHLKAFLDALLEFCHAVFLFRAKSKDTEKSKEIAAKRSEEFYKAYDNLEKKLRVMPSLYDKVRNYATRKPYRTKKYRVFFGANTRCDGWSYTQESANKSSILRKRNNSKGNYNYYLGIYTKQCEGNEYFNDDEGNMNDPSSNNGTSCFEKMMYYQNTNIVQNVVRTFLLPLVDEKILKAFTKEEEKAEIDKLGKNPYIRRLKKEKSDHRLIEYIRNKIVKQYGINLKEADNYHTWTEFINDVALVDYYKICIKNDPNLSKLDLQLNSKYESLASFLNDIKKVAYVVSFKPVQEEIVRKMVKDGKLLLFQIYNKDFSKKSKGRANLHTIYWKELFCPENLENPLYKLNGKAELFFREASLKETETTVHRKGDKKENKNPDSSTNTETGFFPHDIIKDKRFTKDSYQFHVPITLNYQCGKATQKQFNDSCIEYIKQLPENDIHFIGIDRGERHLIYLSLIDRHGNIVEQKSYNEIKSQTTKADGTSFTSTYDYHKALDKKEKEREEARVNWDSITAIKDLKSGFLSQVVSDIARMMVNYHAIVALEDLDVGFKRGRFKIEKQVYQKFEKALIDKLNYLVFKDKAPDEEGGLRHPLQLTAPFESFKKPVKQTGMLFYVPAAYTSKIDPTTGFVDQLKPHYENETQAREFFNKFDSIQYNGNDNEKYFVFKVNYQNMGVSDQKQIWEICTHGGACRWIFDRKKERPVPVNVTENLKTVLKEKGIEYENRQDLRDALKQGDKELLETFIKGLRDVLRLRYIDKDGNDVLISPVKIKDGDFFITSSDETKNDKFPVNPDANGAYHIALKMLLLYERIRSQKKTELVIKNQDWFDYAYQRCAKHNQ